MKKTASRVLRFVDYWFIPLTLFLCLIELVLFHHEIISSLTGMTMTFLWLASCLSLSGYVGWSYD